MTVEDAIARFENFIDNDCYTTDFQEACKLAVSALREKQEREKNERIQYNRLMRLANKMHLYIFLHTGDERGAYDEIGLTDEENAILGYSGEFELRQEGSDNDA